MNRVTVATVCYSIQKSFITLTTELPRAVGRGRGWRARLEARLETVRALGRDLPQRSRQISSTCSNLMTAFLQPKFFD